MASPKLRESTVALFWIHWERLLTISSILWIFRVMTCDAYYRHHPSDLYPSSLSATSLVKSAIFAATDIETEGDKCAIRAIDSSTALSMSLLGASTTIFGVANLFLTGTLIKRIGLKRTLMVQISFAAVRLFIQNVAIELGEDAGILLFQCSQMVSVLGGPSGYVLVLNNYITEVVDYEARTAALGILQGCMMFGSATGFLVGGIASDVIGIKAPFRMTFLLFISSCAYVAFFLPAIVPEKSEKLQMQSKTKRSGLSRVFGPLAVFSPKKFVGKDNVIRTEYGCFLLAVGVFLGINATGYIPTLLQLYATDEFGFRAKENGYLIFMYSLLRGLFLTLAFPRLIKLGRSWTTKREEKAQAANKETGESERLLSARNSVVSSYSEGGTKKEQRFEFDLQYARFSLILDGLLTLLCSFVREGWQMYLVATVLPFAAGTSSAAKGTILQMVGSSATSSERTDALAGVSLVENIARLSTSTCIIRTDRRLRLTYILAFLFGVIFAGFASIGRLNLVFVCNAVSTPLSFP